MTYSNSPERDSSGEPTGYKKNYFSPSAQAISVLTEQGVDLNDAISLLSNKTLISDFVDSYRQKGINIEPTSLPHLIRTYGQDRYRSIGNSASGEA